MKTLPELFSESIRKHGGRPAVLAPDRAALTYAELGDQIERTARILAEAGFGRHDRVALALPQGPEFPVAIAALCSAAVCVPLNDQLAEGAIAELLAAMRVNALIVAEGADSAAARAARRLAIPLLELRLRADAPAGAFGLIARDRRAPVRREDAQPRDVALVSHTSGTTGVPKILPFQHWHLAEDVRVRNQLEGTAIGAEDRCLYVAPFYSMAAIRHGVLRALAAGGSIVCPTRLDVATLVSLLETMQPTLLLAPPVVQVAMLEEFERRQRRPAHVLRFIQSGFTELSPSLKQRLEQSFGVPVIAIYGMSETGLISQSLFPPARTPDGSTGRACVLDVAVADEAGRLLEPGQRGEIVVRGPQVFGGYENNDEANRQAFRDGWFRTGDAGSIDREGFLFLSGRIKDMINRGGNKIAPGDIEAAILEHPQVSEAAAFAVPHATLGEDAAVAVVLRDARTTESELRRFLRSRLVSFKLPSRIIVLPELPRGTLEKIDRVKLAELARRAGAAQFEPPRTRQEIELARIFAEILGVPAIGRQGNFFDLGGDSLRGVRVLVSVESLFGISLSLEALFDNPTVAAFASRIGAAAAAQDQASGQSGMNPARGSVAAGADEAG
jgi:oxalate---CoA ligase